MTAYTAANAAVARLAETLQRTAAESLNDIAQTSAIVWDTLSRGHTVFACGNGGSAASAQHFTAELVGRYVDERKPLKALSLTTDSSLLTAVGNDYGYEQVFARQVQGLGREGDLLVALTTSGESKNVLEALKAASAARMSTIALTGTRGAQLKKAEFVSASVVVPETETARIQEVHDLIIHIWCEHVDNCIRGGD